MAMDLGEYDETAVKVELNTVLNKLVDLLDKCVCVCVCVCVWCVHICVWCVCTSACVCACHMCVCTSMHDMITGGSIEQVYSGNRECVPVPCISCYFTLHSTIPRFSKKALASQSFTKLDQQLRVYRKRELVSLFSRSKTLAHLLCHL